MPIDVTGLWGIIHEALKAPVVVAQLSAMEIQRGSLAGASWSTDEVRFC